jgi:hypothetical protein
MCFTEIHLPNIDESPIGLMSESPVAHFATTKCAATIYLLIFLAVKRKVDVV